MFLHVMIVYNFGGLSYFLYFRLFLHAKKNNEIIYFKDAGRVYERQGICLCILYIFKFQYLVAHFGFSYFF